MGIEIADAYVSIKPSSKGLQNALSDDLKGIDKIAQAEGDKAGKSFGQKFATATGTSLDQMGKTALRGFAAAGLAIYGVANAAGDLQAAISANEQVLGDLSGTIQTWAKTSVEQFGLSERAAIDAATSFGAIGKVAELTGQPLANFSQDLVGLAADMAAFANVPVSQTLQDLQGGFAGQTEVLRKYNVYLDDAGLKAAYYNETGIKVTGTLSAQERIIATNAELWRQTADQQGQAAREADGFARAQDNFKATLENTAASIGTAVLPAVTSMLSGFTTGIGVVGDFNEATGGLVGQLLLMSATGLGTVGVIATVTGKISNAVDRFGDMSRAAQKVTLGFGLAAVAAVAIVAVLDGMGAKEREVAARTKEVAAALPAATKEMWQLAESSARAGGNLDGVAIAQRALGKALTGTGEEGEQLTRALSDLGLQTDDTVDLLASFKDDPVAAMVALGQAQGLNATQARILADAVNETDKSFRDISSPIQDFNFEAKNSAQAFEVMALNLTGSVDGLDRVAGAMEQVQDSSENVDFTNVVQGSLAASYTANEAAAALIEQAEATAGASRSGDDAYLVWLEYNRLLGLLPASQRAVIEGTGDLGEAQADLNKVQADTIDMTTDLEDGFAAAAAMADGFRSALDKLIGGQIGLQASQDELRKGALEIDAVIAELADTNDLNTEALSANTEAGLANREMFRQQASSALDLAGSMLETGASVDEASWAILGQREALIGQLEQFGFTRQAAEEYVAQLGLTPDNIVTAVELAGTEDARTKLQGMLDQLITLDAGAAAEIQADIDEGSFARAAQRIRVLTGQISVSITAKVGQSSRSAFGNYFDKPGFTSIAEDGDPEAVLTLGKPANLERQLQDPRIGNPILTALQPMVEPLGSADNLGAAGGIHFAAGAIQINSEVDLDGLLRMINFHQAGF